MSSTQDTALPTHHDDDSPPGMANGAPRRASPWTWYLRPPMAGTPAFARKNHALACLGEFVGTFLFLFFAFGAAQTANQAATTVSGTTTPGPGGIAVGGGNTSSIFYIAMAFGLSLAVNAWVFFRFTGSLFNPAVTLGLALVGGITPLRAVFLVPVQLLGGICAAAVIDALTPGPILFATTLAPGMSPARGLFMEMFMTTMLLLTIFLLAAERTKVTPFSPIGIGLALAICHLVGIYWTGCGMNPARSLGPEVVSASFPGYAWIYWLGPALGATLAAGFYRLLKALQYETVLGEESADASTKRLAGELARHMGLGGQFQSSAPGGGGMGHSGKAGEGDDRTATVQGPGMTDLLTRQPSMSPAGGVHMPGQTFSAPLPSPTGTLDTLGNGGDATMRFDRLEHLVQQLLRQGGGGGARPAGLARMTSAEGTLIEDPREFGSEKKGAGSMV
ncbi:hypothetical protein JCM8208_001162 [Rhodotorula glutinis]